MAFLAKFGGKCFACGGEIKTGQLITWNRRKGRKGVVRHEDCAHPDAKGKALPPIVVEGAPEMPEDLETELENEDHEELELEAPPETEDTLEKILSEDTPAKLTERFPRKRRTATEVESKGGDAEAAFEIMAEALKRYIKTGEGSVNEAKVRAIVADTLAERNPLVVQIEVPGKPPVVKDNMHKQFPRLLHILGKRHHAYLFGGPGSGKSTGARQAAEALGISFGYISLNPQTPDSRLLGYLDANGIYRRTVFRDCYENGGVFCIDELDNASASLLTTLNSSLENGVAPFPDGMIEKHKDFVVVGTGNTAGRGAHPAFPERRPFDAAFAERFLYLSWDYDEKLERNIALTFNADAGKLVDYVQELRKWSAKNMPRLVVSPRASFYLAQYVKSGQVPLLHLIDMVILKGVDADSRRKVLDAVALPEGVA